MTLDDWNKIAEIIFYLVTGSVAVAGINAWWTQLAGKNEYEIAKNIVAGAYKIRDAIKQCQAPFMSPNEWADRSPIAGETEAERHAGESFHAYGKRFKKIIEAMEQWYSYTVEAEAVFGPEAKLKTEAIEASVSKLNAAIIVYHRLMYKNSLKDEHEKYFNIINGLNEFTMPHLSEGEPVYDDDGFQRELDARLKEIEVYFMKFMRKKALEV